MASTRRFQGK
jgi:Rad and Gem related GTP binding protein 1